jgi:hypothetical protein
MRMKRDIARYKAASLTLFLAILTGTGWAVSPATSESNAMSFTVNLREWFVLEVQTSEANLESSGATGANVTATMSPDGIPARIKALTVVANSRAVELRVQVFGDLVGPSGETLPLSEVSWAGAGDGFQSGQFTSSGSAVLASWVGPGYHEGTVQYFSPKTNATGGKYVQRIVYSLMST